MAEPTPSPKKPAKKPGFSFGTSYPQLGQPTPAPTPTPVPKATPAPAVPNAAAAPPDFLRDFLQQILAPALQAQTQFQNDSRFGRHLDMAGNPVGQGMRFEDLAVPMDQRIAKERATFGGQSFTGGDRVMPTAAAMAGTQPPPQTMGHMPQGPQGIPQPSWGSPVYRQQHPEFNMFSQQAYSTVPNPNEPKFAPYNQVQQPYRRMF